MGAFEEQAVPFGLFETDSADVFWGRRGRFGRDYCWGRLDRFVFWTTTFGDMSVATILSTVAANYG
jgi:hypothetical protein